MIENKKIIGVCLTKIHDASRSDYINRLHILAQKHGFKLIIFNSFIDFYKNDDFDIGARAVYDIINYDIIDAVVIIEDSFLNKSIPESIISGAKAHNVPVILVNGEAEGCCSVTGDFKDAFKSVITHVIKEHGVRDAFFMAGKKDDNISQMRLDCYKEALEENGIPFDESKVDYGEYWDVPAKRIMHRLLENGKKPPEAVICANDQMAFAVCGVLNEYGYKVPDDVIVTGFDGLRSSKYFSPRLTTCDDNPEGLAELTCEIIERSFESDISGMSFKNKFLPRISESCGCIGTDPCDYRKMASELHNMIEETEAHEDFMYAWIDRTIEVSDMNSLYKALSGSIMENSYVCLNQDFISIALGNKTEDNSALLSDKLVVIPSEYSKNESIKNDSFSLSDMVPGMTDWLSDNTSYLLNSIYVGKEVCGYYAVKTDSIYKCRHKIKRILKTINIAFTSAMNYFKQKRMILSIENASLINNVTGLPNLKGTVKWFDEFSEKEENHRKALSVSVYGLPKYTYIYENYGINDIEESMRFVAESLKLANPKDCFVGHIAEDEFVIINYYDDANKIPETIDSATSVFFSVVEGYNTDSKKPYYVEVNCGCTVLNPGWDGALESFIKIANSEMYMNRLKSGTSAVVKEKTTLKDYYKAFEVLVEKNLFNYHFQPIVNAKNGDIFAYEALMRTDSSIGMSPLEILETAKEYKRLYDIEKATMFNVMKRFADEREKFGNCKVFINTIPGYFLNPEDNGLLLSKYGNYMENVVFELTEQDTVSDEELNSIKRLCGSNSTGQIAIDDYGTGHSNIVNLMRYSPQVIKIDRFLISDIHKNQNKQLFVRSTIEFARLNNIKVLAEGVETSNELRTVIDLGVDLIQGYYTGRPVQEPVRSIAEEIRREIIEANPLFGQE
ncbi:MAG: EAL domain-containing protein [Oscillospiraceae bacterium]